MPAEIVIMGLCLQVDVTVAHQKNIPTVTGYLRELKKMEILQLKELDSSFLCKCMDVEKRAIMTSM